MWYWKIMHQSGQEIMAGLVPYASADLAREASRRERMGHRWTMADGYYDKVEEQGEGSCLRCGGTGEVKYGRRLSRCPACAFQVAGYFESIDHAAGL